jgi:PAS domain S-box-containing protein
MTSANDQPPASSANDGEDLHRLLVESVKDYAIFVLDPAGYVCTWNIGAERIKGYSAAEIIGKHFSVFYPQVDLDDGKPARELAIATETGVNEEEGWRVRKDGSLFWASVVTTALRKPNGTLAGFAKVTRDLTERRAAQERAILDARRFATAEVARRVAEMRESELRTLTERLESQQRELERRTAEAEEANSAKVKFLAAMSHELRTPLNAIGGYTQLLEMGIGGAVNDQQRSHLARILRSQQHLLAVINDLLNFSRIEAGHVTYDVGPVSLWEVVASVMPMILPQASAKNIALSALPDGESPPARGDRAKIEQIVINLLSNAVKFTPDGGAIEVATGRRATGAWLSVRDNGIGIPGGQQTAVFEPFVQVGRGLANPKEGAGLGLAISRDLARAMQGELTVESAEGAGSTFTLALPLDG